MEDCNSRWWWGARGRLGRCKEVEDRVDQKEEEGEDETDQGKTHQGCLSHSLPTFCKESLPSSSPQGAQGRAVQAVGARRVAAPLCWPSL